MDVGPPMKVALYHRVSTVDQNPDAARAELRQAARRMGARVALDVRETGKGTNNDRPGLARVLDAAQRGDVDAVLVWKLDRFGRSAFDLLGNIRRLDTAGVRFIAVTQGIDIRPGGDPMSRMLVTMLSAVAEFERALIVERTRLGMAHARERGAKLGRPRVALPDADAVAQLRRARLTWDQVAHRLGCSPWAARLAAGAVTKGGRKTGGRARRERPQLGRL